MRCKNKKFLKEDDIFKHQLKKAFLLCFENWIVHGKLCVIEPMLVGPSLVGIGHVVNDVWLENSYTNLVLDAMGVGDEYSNNKVSSLVVAYELPNPKATDFYKLLKVVWVFVG